MAKEKKRAAENGAGEISSTSGDAKRRRHEGWSREREDVIAHERHREKGGSEFKKYKKEKKDKKAKKDKKDKKEKRGERETTEEEGRRESRESEEDVEHAGAHDGDDDMQSDRASDEESDTMQPADDALRAALVRVAARLSVDALFDSGRGKKEISGAAVEGAGGPWSVDAALVGELSVSGREALAAALAPVGLRVLALAKAASMRMGELAAGDAGATQRQKKGVRNAELTARDIETNPALPLPRQYTEMALWRLIASAGAVATGHAAELCTKGRAESDADGASPAPAESRTFRDLYVAMATDAFGDDLDALRRDADFSQDKIGLLIDCLRTGADTWGAVEQGLWQLHLSAGGARRG